MVVLLYSQGERASELGATRLPLNRALCDFVSLGPIAFAGSRATLRDPKSVRLHAIRVGRLRHQAECWR